MLEMKAIRQAGLALILTAAASHAVAARGENGAAVVAGAGGRPPAAMPAEHDHNAMMHGMEGPSIWTLYPTLKIRMGGRDRDSMVVSVVPQKIEVGSVSAFSNNFRDENGRRLLPLEMAGAKLDKPATGGFHWLSAREERGDSVWVASTVYNFNGSGAKDPTAMFMKQKNELEIIPQPHPREHARYRANEVWKFLVRFNGQPLAGHKVWLETANGSMDGFVSDAEGVIRMRLPDDFPAEEEQPAAGGHNHGGMRRSSEFVLATEHADGGRNYLTAFNSSYGPDAYDKRNLAMGLGFTLLGMLGAAPLLRKRKNGQKAEESENA